MRKKSLVLFSSLAILLLGSCGTQHSHTFASDWTHDENNHWHAATCEHKDEVVDKASHAFGDWSVKKGPTCEEDGVEERVCSVCKKTETRVVSKTGHTYAETWTSNETHHWHASTCGHDVKSSYAEHTPATDGKCSVCGYQVETPISYQVTEEQYNAAISIAAFENVTIDYKDGFIKFDGNYIEEYEEEDEHSLSVKIAENSFKIYINQDSQWVEITTTSEDKRAGYASFFNLGYKNVAYNETNKCYDCTDSKVIANFYVYDKKADSVHQYFEDGKLVKLVSVAGETSLTMSFINYGTTVAARPTTD